MKCKSCGVEVVGNEKFCPLCQNPLEGDPDGEELYPVIKPKLSRYAMFFKILLFISVCSCVLSGCVNYLLPESGLWSLAVLLANGCLWVMLYVILRQSATVQRTIMMQVLAISLISVAWDMYSGWHGWSISYVLPCVCASAVIVMFICGLIMGIPLVDYIFFVTANCVFGIVPIVLLLTGAVNEKIPSVICAALSLIFLGGLIIFQGKNMYSELYKKMHL